MDDGGTWRLSRAGGSESGSHVANYKLPRYQASYKPGLALRGRTLMISQDERRLSRGLQRLKRVAFIPPGSQGSFRFKAYPVRYVTQALGIYIPVAVPSREA